jgi:hypothetical protein
MVLLVAVLILVLWRKWPRVSDILDLNLIQQAPVAGCMIVACRSKELLDTLQGTSGLKAKERDKMVKKAKNMYYLGSDGETGGAMVSIEHVDSN